MARVKTEHLEDLLSFLRRDRGDDASVTDVFTLAEITVESLQAFFRTMDAALYRELREIADYIQSMKQEIGALQPNEIKDRRIPAAGEELSAIVRATEEATNTIMECAEVLMATKAEDAAAYKALVDEKMLVIFEACSFQDITGQRIAKVIETLQQIEARVSRFVNAVAARDAAGFVNETERARAERKKALLLNGPQRKGEAIDQAEVDSLLRGEVPGM